MHSESLCGTNEEIIAILINRLRPKRSSKVTKKLSNEIEGHYIGVDFHMESFCGAWCVKEVAKLQPFYR